MPFTVSGSLILAIAFFVALFHQKWSYALSVFFIPFTATAVANTDFGDGAALQVPTAVGAIWMIQQAFFILRRDYKFARLSGSFMLLLFLGVAIVSAVVMPLWIDGAIAVRYPSLDFFEETPLTFRGQNVTQTGYLAFGVLFALFVGNHARKADLLRASLRVYVISGAFVALWGIYQFIVYRLSLPYPEVLFNNSIDPSVLGALKQEFRALELRRLTSVQVGPYALSKYLLTVLSVLAAHVVTGVPLLRPRVDFAVLLLVVTTLVLSTSFSAYIGIVALGVLFLLITPVLRLRRVLEATTLGLILALTIFYVAWVSSPGFVTAFERIVLEKFGSSSAGERWLSVVIATEYFEMYPLLGLGFGTTFCHDTVVFLLVNVGIIGFTAFFFAVIIPFRKAMVRIIVMRDHFRMHPTLYATCLSIIISFGLMIFLDLFTGFTFVYLHFWFWLGMLMAIATLTEPREKDRYGIATQEA
ncbi:O-antigen ligase family protein [Candidatus Thiosymbion oneisti]|uniref:O-antigen ligase family protein n=1 Tax=Candidatus Thiosymbion oneisti TaxID=589554 RepID=UPI00105F0F2F|nr:O-antigen ligase family protein [Candidatus Thiosymbion oneisti]